MYGFDPAVDSSNFALKSTRSADPKEVFVVVSPAPCETNGAVVSIFGVWLLLDSNLTINTNINLSIFGVLDSNLWCLVAVSYILGCGYGNGIQIWVDEFEVCVEDFSGRVLRFNGMQ